MGVKQLLEISTVVMLGRLIYAEQTTNPSLIASSLVDTATMAV